ncbi:hypothetical protein Cni_G09010 [Canna indica]|uniref:DUF7731 domain-containing protein n=1 Tax=Canna indica TaxID=4628 RepID=A0AAQ3K1W1_9LILI|nr:hypothetical protein Cni_G09010 [Canna indica]
MASSFLLKPWCFSLAVLYFLASLCKSAESYSTATSCFINHNIYVRCQEAYRLSAEGEISVPPQAAEDFCGGPCLVETRLVLDCVERMLHGFEFYNGASVLDVRFSLATACSHTNSRGDFHVRPNQSAKVVPDDARFDDYNYDHGSKLSVVSVYLVGLLLLSLTVLLL